MAGEAQLYIEPLAGVIAIAVVLVLIVLWRRW